MERERAEKLVEYVSSMVDYGYDIQPERIYNETKNRSDEINKGIQKIYSQIEGQRFCTKCDTMKMYDEIREEWYCPIHQFD